MKKILLGFIAIGLLTFVGCDKDDDTDTTDSTETSSDNGSTDSDADSGDDTKETSSDDGSTDCDDGITETSSDEIADSDGNTYKTVIIGEQEWFAENLKTSRYNDGTPIPNITGNTEWGDDTTGAWCHYDNDSDYECTYGKLYNWYAVETGKLCPTGWHVPTDAEWTVLDDYLTANGYKGKALKSTYGWDDYDNDYGWDDYEGISGNGTDDYGWNGLPGGARGDYGYFGSIGSGGMWWSSSQNATSDAWSRYLYNGSASVGSYIANKETGYSVRCIKD